MVPRRCTSKDLKIVSFKKNDLQWSTDEEEDDPAVPPDHLVYVDVNDPMEGQSRL